MSVIYYRELLASEFFERLENWHSAICLAAASFHRNPNPNKMAKSREVKLFGRSVRQCRGVIAEAAYGDVLKSNDTLKKNLHRTYHALPSSMAAFSARHHGYRHQAEQVIETIVNLGSGSGIWASLAPLSRVLSTTPGQTAKEGISMSLEEDRPTRDYLYGRLLAIAERIEDVALSVGGESGRPRPRD